MSTMQLTRAGSPAGTALAGFIAGAIGVLLGHQLMVLILYLTGFVPNAPYSFRANPWGVPIIINSMFWGGLWGILYAFVAPRFPAGWTTLVKGAFFGFAIHVFLGNWIIVALIRGNPTFSSFVPLRMLIGALIGTAFGIGVAFAYSFVAPRLAR